MHVIVSVTKFKILTSRNQKLQFRWEKSFDLQLESCKHSGLQLSISWIFLPMSFNINIWKIEFVSYCSNNYIKIMHWNLVVLKIFSQLLKA